MRRGERPEVCGKKSPSFCALMSDLLAPEPLLTVDSMPTIQQVEETLRSALDAEDVSVVDISGE